MTAGDLRWCRPRWALFAFGALATGSGCGAGGGGEVVAPPPPPIQTDDYADGAGSDTPRGLYTWADSVDVGTPGAPHWVKAGIQGDGRLRNGATAVAGGPSNEYQGDFCGVSAVIGRGDQYDEGLSFFSNPARFWADTLPATCLPSRRHRFYLDGTDKAPVLGSPVLIMGPLWDMTIGDERLVPFTIGVSPPEMGAYKFDPQFPGSSYIRIVRLSDTTDAARKSVKRWRVSSQGTHKAVDANAPTQLHFLPFAVTVTQVRNPIPHYP